MKPEIKSKKHILLGKFDENFENTGAVSFLNHNKWQQ